MHAGETVGLIGPSGSGKTSLLMIIAGLERATAGRVVVAGEDLTRLDEDGLAAFRGRRVGVVFQNFHLVATMTALENVALPLELAGPAGRLRPGEGAARGRRPGPSAPALSGAAFGRRAAARRPGPRLRRRAGAAACRRADRQPRRRPPVARSSSCCSTCTGAGGTTLLLITHDPALAGRCARTIELKDGRIVADRRTPALSAVGGR